MFQTPILLTLLLSSLALGQQTPSPATTDPTQQAAPAPLADTEPYELGPGIVSPERIETPSPEYTREALDAQITGAVILSVWVERDGTFSHVTVKSGLGHGLDEAALRAVKRWRYKPATKDGQPVIVHALIKVNFKIEE